MELTTKGRYAVMAMADLASHADQSCGSAVAGRGTPALAACLSGTAFCAAAPHRPRRERARPGRRLQAREGALPRFPSPPSWLPSRKRRVSRGAPITIRAVRRDAVSDARPVERAERGDIRISGIGQSGRRASEAESIPLRPAHVIAAIATAASRVYLDYNATAPLRSEAKAAMIAALDVVGNASSVHAEGRRAHGIIEAARERRRSARWRQAFGSRVYERRVRS